MKPQDLPAAIELDERWLLAQRIVASPVFSKSARLCTLLLHITRKAIEGRTDELTETQIGVHVFGRAPGYNSGEDNIVRSHARLLRQKLEAYFDQAGGCEELILTIPKGGYVPTFEARAGLSPDPAALHPAALIATSFDAPPEAFPPSATTVRKRWRVYLVAAILLAAAILIARWPKNPQPPAPDARISRLLWSRIFQTNRNTILVVADSGLVMYENLARRTVHLPEYLSRQYLSTPLAAGLTADSETIRGLAIRRYTSLADLDLMTAMVRVPEVVPGRLRIRYARDLSVGDFKESNVVLSGAIESNPWLELFDNRLNFHIVDDQSRGIFSIGNQSPAPGEPKNYVYDPKNADQPAYSVVAFLSDHSAPTNAMVIEGTTVAGTEAAADFVLDDKTISPILRRAQFPDGSIGDFQVLLATRNLAGSAPRAQVVTVRYGPPNP